MMRYSSGTPGFLLVSGMYQSSVLPQTEHSMVFNMYVQLCLMVPPSSSSMPLNLLELQ
nr:hypothetical protein [Candidatus Sigynarchaeota archaeon]